MLKKISWPCIYADWCRDSCHSCSNSRIRIFSLSYYVHILLGVHGKTMAAACIFLLYLSNSYQQSSSFLQNSVRISMQVVTGLLIAEVNVNTMCELGSGSVSLVSSFLFLKSQGGMNIDFCKDKYLHRMLVIHIEHWEKLVIILLFEQIIQTCQFDVKSFQIYSCVVSLNH